MRLTLRMLASLILISMLNGCAGDRHHIQTAGQTGVMVSESEAAFPDGDGKLVVGKVKLVPGVMIRNPKSDQEVIDTLKAAGAVFK